ncbi:hypothetical protein AAG570_001665 [Ranatra chinensis]|uniref:Uncharacterized protein n=1 Tax=Ranatra chinensis TaxID=642074 RepID=A0ABD0Y968_9HEMI
MASKRRNTFYENKKQETMDPSDTNLFNVMVYIKIGIFIVVYRLLLCARWSEPVLANRHHQRCCLGQTTELMGKQEVILLSEEPKSTEYSGMVLPLMPTKLEGHREVPLHIPVNPEEDPPSYQDEVINSDIQNPRTGRWGFTLGSGQQQTYQQQQLQQQLLQPQQQQLFQPQQQQQVYQPQQQQQPQQFYQPQQQQQPQQFLQPEQQQQQQPQQFYQPQQQQSFEPQQQLYYQMQDDQALNQPQGQHSLQRLLSDRQQLQENYGSGYSDFEASGTQATVLGGGQGGAAKLHLLADVAGGREYGTGHSEYVSASHIQSSAVAGGHKVTIVSHVDHHEN